MSQEDRFYRIVEEGLCIGCGLCQAVAGPERIEIVKASNGELRPRVRAQLDEATVDLIYATCPGTRVEGLPPELAEAAPFHDLVWGPYHRLVLGWAAEPAVRFEGSTGGVLTALGRYLLASERVAFLLQVKASEAEPTHGEATLSETESAVLEAAGSRYGPTAPLVALDAALARDEPFAVIAKPCDLNALRNLAHHDPRIDRLVRYWLTPVCGGYMPDAAMSAFLARLGIDRAQVTGLRYRGRGCPGPTTLSLADGDRRELHYLDVWGEDESAWSLPFRCKICPDGIGEAADIAAADCWPGGSPDREGSASDPGTNALIVRTAAGLALLEAAVRDGALVLGEAVDAAFMDDVQPHQVKKKRAAFARFQGLRDAGGLAPETVGLRLEELAKRNEETANARERQGAYRRSREGRQRETRPR